MTIQEIIREKTPDKDERRIIEKKVRKAMQVSERHFYRIKSGTVKLSVDKAAAAAAVLKVPVSKLAAVFLVFFSLASCQSTGNGPIPREIILDGCTYAVHKLEGNPVLIHREECGNHRHRNSEVIYWDEYRTGQYVQ